MSFQAYIDNIKVKTGKSPEDFRDLAIKAGVLTTEMKAGDLIYWLKNEYDLGRGHSMAIYAVFKAKGWVAKPNAKSATRK